MTLHDKNDALNAEMMAIGAAAREAARAVREADDATKTKALREAARAIRAAQGGNPGRQCARPGSGQGEQHGRRDAGPAGAQ